MTATLSPWKQNRLSDRLTAAHNLFNQTVIENKWIGGERWNDGGFPHPKQQQFLFNFERELFFGGAGGGGKSQAAWYGALQFVGVPGYAALIFRRTYADLSLPKALMSRAKSYLGEDSGASWNEGQKTWTFPSGATITFAYLESENDKYRYASAEFQYIFFDELTQFTESQYTFLFTRLRRGKVGSIAGVPLRMRSASNPGGPGHGWVYNRFVNAKTRDSKRCFIPATMRDNPTLDVEDYKESLSNTDPLTRKQIEEGNWNAIEGGRFKKEWFEHRYTLRGDYIVLVKPGVAMPREVRWQECDRFMTVDPAASEKTTSDWTVALVWLKTPWNELLLWDGLRFQAQIPDIIPRLESLSKKWGCSGVWIEAVAANNGVYSFARRTTMPAKSLSPMGQDKLVRATPAMNLASDGRIWLPVPGLRSTLPLEDIESEWYLFTGNDKADAHDDSVDCLSYAANILISGPNAAARSAVPIILGGNM